jgi:hypothetical protein
MHVYPVATIVTEEGTSEVSRVYFSNGVFELGHGHDVAVRGAHGATIESCQVDLGRGLKLKLSSGHTLFIPATRMSGTYR